MISLLFPFAIAATIGWTPATSTVAFDNASAIVFAEKEFAGTPLMAIARCESHLQQFDDEGYVLQGRVNHQDLGFGQINAKYHLAEATRLGFDLFSAQGNIMYTRYLYEMKGASPWSASNRCHHALDTDSTLARSP